MLPTGDNKPVTEVMKPVTVAIVGTGNGGITRSVVATTPPDQPNIQVRYIPKFKALLARFLHTYSTILLTLVGAGMTTNVIPYTDFLNLVWKCMGLALAGAGFDVLKGLTTITSQWAKDNPLLSGEV